jgi:diaminopimelate epimerase
MRVIKAHAYGNDFLLAAMGDIAESTDRAGLARRLCARHTGVGADGLMLVAPTKAGAVTRLLNADGSRSEISGNGIRCVVAWLVRRDDLAAGSTVVIETEAGDRRVDILAREGPRVLCRASMGPARALRETTLPVAGHDVRCVVMNMGNPQCVVLGPPDTLTQDRLYSIAAGLATHPYFPEGTNVELAAVEAPGRVRILIWERGVGPTEASGTGACGAAVAAVHFGGAVSPVDVVAPGGTQQVEVSDEDVLLTGWAEVIAHVEWWGQS